MKKTLTLIAIIFVLNANAQEKKDTTIAIHLPIDQYRALLYTIDTNIDSKKVSKELLEFISKNAQIVADKPKPIK